MYELVQRVRRTARSCYLKQLQNPESHTKLVREHRDVFLATLTT